MLQSTPLHSNQNVQQYSNSFETNLSSGFELFNVYRSMKYSVPVVSSLVYPVDATGYAGQQAGQQAGFFPTGCGPAPDCQTKID